MRKFLALLLVSWCAIGCGTTSPVIPIKPPPTPPVKPPDPTVKPPDPPVPTPETIESLLARISVGMSVDQATVIVGVEVYDRPPNMARWVVDVGSMRYLVFVNLDASGVVTTKGFSVIQVIR